MILILVTMILLTSCQTLRQTETKTEYTFYPPELPSKPYLQWVVDGGVFSLPREQAIDLAQYFRDLETYHTLLRLTFEEIEKVVNNVTGIHIEIQ